MSYVRLKRLHFFWLTLLQGDPCLEVMGHDKEIVAYPSVLKVLIDLKVTNGVHSSEFPSLIICLLTKWRAQEGMLLSH